MVSLSPNYQDTDFTYPLPIEDKIELFADRVLGWQLNVAKQMIYSEKTEQTNFQNDLSGPTGPATVDDCISGVSGCHPRKTLNSLTQTHSVPSVLTSYEGIQHSDFAVLSTVISYFEMIIEYKSGQSSSGQSRKFFIDGIIDVFPELSSTSKQFFNKFYDYIRCGLYHSGQTRKGVFVTSNTGTLDQPIKNENGEIYVNTRLLFERIETHFNEYVNLLRNPDNHALRESFDIRFDL